MKLLSPQSPAKNTGLPNGWLLAVLVLVLFTACQKTVDVPAPIVAHSEIKEGATFITGFRSSVDGITLQQANADKNAISFSWTLIPGNNPLKYTIEAAAVSSDFSGKTELAYTSAGQVEIAVKELNQKLSSLAPAGIKTRILIRVRATDLYGDHEVLVYSEPITLEVTRYQPTTVYAYPQYIKLPGNYQDWELSNAPQIVSVKNDGEYEGYINFTRQNPQFMFVKGTQWDLGNTFTSLGANKFGFGGNLFSISGNAGSYFIKASTNTNTWSCTRIDKWGIHGTAVTCASEVDPVMTYDAATGNYLTILSLQPGEFRFRANDDDALTLGKETQKGYDTPTAAGKGFTITTPGYYAIYLNLSSAGNYGCALIREFNVFACDNK